MAFPAATTLPTLRLALCQFLPSQLTFAANFSTAASLVRSAASQGAHIALLPEFVLSNYVPHSDPEYLAFHRSAEAKTYLGRFRDLARECGIGIVAGTLVEHTPAEGDAPERFYNTCYYIKPDGEVGGRYRKKNLWLTEREHLTSAVEDEHESFSLGFAPFEEVRAGLLLCWDLGFPEPFRILVSQGAHVVLIPSLWNSTDCTEKGLKRNPRSEEVFINSCVSARAFENTAVVAFCNAFGQSQVAVPFVGCIGSPTEAGEKVRVVEVDLKILDEAEEAYEIRKDLKKEGWHYGPIKSIIGQ